MANNELVGKNVFEMLVFSIGDRTFGINVFKVREIINFQKINSIPGGNANVLGVTTIRGATMPVIDMAKTLNIPQNNANSGFFIITEFNRTVQAFKIDGVSKIENVSWEDVKEPPVASGKKGYLTSIVNIGNSMIQVLDVEKILSEIQGDQIKDNIVESNEGQGKRILIVDDSKVAQNQLARVLRAVGFDIDFKSNGLEALNDLVLLSEKVNLEDYYDVIISDIEMPKMDGYTLVAELRNRGFNDLKIIMHTSMSGVFNKAMVDKVGADNFIPKFDAKEIQECVLNLVFESPRKVAA